MKDFHSHILPGVDDGFKDINDSIEQLRIAEEEGVTDIILTPHYILDSDYKSSYVNNKKIFSLLEKEKKKNNINVNLYLSNEIYINESIDKLIKNNIINPINNKYLLIELPLNSKLNNALDIIFKLIDKGYVVVLAHPERYRFLKENKDAIKEFLDMGVLLQGNYFSLFNRYGRESKRLLKYYLKRKYITFLGSDIHRVGKYNIKKLKFKLKLLGLNKDYIEDVLERNFSELV